MAKIPITMPQLGESIAEATITRLLVRVGEMVRADQEVMEVETDKAILTVTAPNEGKVKELLVKVDQTYAVGAILGYLEGVGNHNTGQDETLLVDSVANQETPPAATSTSDQNSVKPTVRGLPVPALTVGATYMSPRMKARINELGLHAADLAGLPGRGAAGRITIEDLESFLSQLEKKRRTPASSMRVAVADAMRRSWTRPLATVGLPVSLDKLLAHRRQQDPKPGPTLYALRAFAMALFEDPRPAGRLIGNQIVHPSSIDIGFAVEAEDGVLVPVIRSADRKPLSELIVNYLDLLHLARQRRLTPAVTEGSVAAVTNYGTFGLTWATPIPLPEQTLVLGLGAGCLVPRWDPTEEAFLPATEANLTLSFDHRVLDGGGAGRLLTRVADFMNSPESL